MSVEREFEIIVKAVKDREIADRLFGSPTERLLRAEAQQRVELLRLHRANAWFSHGVRQYQALLGRDLASELAEASRMRSMNELIRHSRLAQSVAEELAERARLRAADIARIASIGIPSTNDVFATLLAQKSYLGSYEHVFERAFTGALGGWRGAIDRDVLQDIQHRLAEETEAAEQSGTQVDLADLVASAVVAAMAERDTRANWQFVVGIILSLLLFVYQEHGSEATKRELERRIAGVQEVLVARDYLLDLLERRTIARATRLLAQPKSGARRLSTLAPGDRVVVLERKGKWTRIAVPQVGDRGSTGRVGWILNKYLE